MTTNTAAAGTRVRPRASAPQPAPWSPSAIKTVFDALAVDRVATQTLLQQLRGLDEAPWANMRGKPLDALSLAAHLARYGIGPRQFRVGQAKTRGYERCDFLDAWRRYHPDRASSTGPGTPGTPGTFEAGTGAPSSPVPGVPGLPPP